MDNVEVVERGNIVVNIYEGQKGAAGEPGKSLRFEDLTPEQKAELKGEKGDKGDNANVEPVYHLLVNRGYLPASDSLTDVLTYIIDRTGNFGDNLEGLELTLERQPQYGDTVLMVRCSHIEGMVIKERGSDKTYTISNETDWVFPVELSHSMDEREVVLDAIWQGEVKYTLVIPGITKTKYLNIANDQLELLTSSHTYPTMAYVKKDDQLWLQSLSYPIKLDVSMIAGLFPEVGQLDFNTLVLRLQADPDVQLADSSNAFVISYAPVNSIEPSSSISSSNTVIIPLEQCGFHFNNFVVTREKGSGVSNKETITFIAPNDMLVGVVSTDETNIPCMPVSKDDVVQINIQDFTVKILGTHGHFEVV